MEQTTQRTWGQKIGGTLGWLAALGVDDHRRWRRFRAFDNPETAPAHNGWFALFSGISACPLTAWLLKKYAGITLSGWARFGIALLIIVIGRLALKIEGRGEFLPGP
jgi:hypothetical protein